MDSKSNCFICEIAIPLSKSNCVICEIAKTAISQIAKVAKIAKFHFLNFLMNKSAGILAKEDAPRFSFGARGILFALFLHKYEI